MKKTLEFEIDSNTADLEGLILEIESEFGPETLLNAIIERFGICRYLEHAVEQHKNEFNLFVKEIDS